MKGRGTEIPNPHTLFTAEDRVTAAAHEKRLIVTDPESGHTEEPHCTDSDTNDTPTNTSIYHRPDLTDGDTHFYLDDPSLATEDDHPSPEDLAVHIETTSTHDIFTVVSKKTGIRILIKREPVDTIHDAYLETYEDKLKQQAYLELVEVWRREQEIKRDFERQYAKSIATKSLDGRRRKRSARQRAKPLESSHPDDTDPWLRDMGGC